MKKRFEGRKVKKMNGLKSEKIQINNSQIYINRKKKLDKKFISNLMLNLRQ